MLLSIIICTYNAGQRLERTLESILKQSIGDCEVIIIDGRSTDETGNVINAYEKIASNLRWISEKDNGIYEAMNKGIAMASGDFVNFIGAGDWLEKDALKNVFKTVELDPEADAVYGKTRIIQGEKERIVQTPVEDLLLQPMQHPAIFYRKSLHEKFGNYDENYKIAADYDFCIKTFLKGKSKVAYINKVVVNFVMDGISSNKKIPCLKETLKARRENNLNMHVFHEISNYIRNIRK